MTVYSLTFNDDYATPYCEVYATENEALEGLFDYLDVPEDDRLILRMQWAEDGEFNEETLNEFKRHDYDSYTIQSHDLQVSENR